MKALLENLSYFFFSLSKCEKGFKQREHRRVQKMSSLFYPFMAIVFCLDPLNISIVHDANKQ
jgi:hypothetical protein